MSRRYRNPTYVRDRESPFCHCFFTPQGLSGHLRFAHKSTEEVDSIVTRHIRGLTERKNRIQMMAKESGLPQEQIREAPQWFDDWRLLILKGIVLGVEFTDVDFKEYMRARFMKSCGLSDK